MNTYLVGFMGAGKSTVGKLAAALLDQSFVDLDQVIEQQEQMSIAELFELHTADGFRILEHRYLHRLDNSSGIVATGGGTPCFFNGMSFMKRTGLTVYLQASPSCIHARLQQDTVRPLLRTVDDPSAFIAQEWPHRIPIYKRGHITVNAELPAQEVAQAVIQARQDWMLSRAYNTPGM